MDYDYTNGPNGPAHWGDLSRGWALCKTGQEQSPIDINTSYVEIAQDAQLLQTNYKHSNAVLTIDKHGLQVNLCMPIIDSCPLFRISTALPTI